ncbi:hypothetical protein BC829DRAFT_422136 [Chytridium lagenaria]|nr:hypothetical protein BC829DRAFT_422136 [Chytridium lagenaria]
MGVGGVIPTLNQRNQQRRGAIKPSQDARERRSTGKDSVKDTGESPRNRERQHPRKEGPSKHFPVDGFKRSTAQPNGHSGAHDTLGGGNREGKEGGSDDGKGCTEFHGETTGRGVEGDIVSEGSHDIVSVERETKVDTERAILVDGCARTEGVSDIVGTVTKRGKGGGHDLEEGVEEFSLVVVEDGDLVGGFSGRTLLDRGDIHKDGVVEEGFDLVEKGADKVTGSVVDEVHVLFRVGGGVRGGVDASLFRFFNNNVNSVGSLFLENVGVRRRTAAEDTANDAESEGEVTLDSEGATSVTVLGLNLQGGFAVLGGNIETTTAVVKVNQEEDSSGKETGKERSQKPRGDNLGNTLLGPPQLTAPVPNPEIPTPMTAPMIEWVVETGHSCDHQEVRTVGKVVDLDDAVTDGGGGFGTEGHGTTKFGEDGDAHGLPEGEGAGTDGRGKRVGDIVGTFKEDVGIKECKGHRNAEHPVYEYAGMDTTAAEDMLESITGVYGMKVEVYGDGMMMMMTEGGKERRW